MSTTTGASTPTTSSSTTTSDPATSPSTTSIPSPPTTTSAPSTTTQPTTTGNSPSTTSVNTSNTSNSLTTTAATPVVVTTTNSNPTRVASSTSGGPAVVTRVTTTFISTSSSSTPTGVQQSSANTHGFFSNKAAVAGVFSVIGLVGLVILIALVTNAVRRRKANRFDKELIDATREAAATTPNPHFLDDEEDGEDRFKRNGYGTTAYGSGGSNGFHGGSVGGPYSDGSHGTYGQPPMDTYNMREIGGHGVGVGDIYDPYPAGGGGAAGIGVARARSMRIDNGNVNPNVYAAALQEGGSPYPKFALGPQHDPYGGGGNGGVSFGRGANMEAAGMGTHVAGAGMISRGQSQQRQYQQQYQQGPQSQEYANVGRSQSTSTNATQLYPPSTASIPQSNSYSQQPPYPVRQVSTKQSSATSSTLPLFPNPHHQPSGGTPADVEEEEDAYGGYVVDSPVYTESTPVVTHDKPQASGTKYMPNPFDGGRESSSGEEGDRRSEDEDEEREEPKRVLKVANE